MSNNEGGILYRCKLCCYQLRRRAFQQKRFISVGAALIVTCWIALNETFALKLIFEQECLSRNYHSTGSCFSSTLERWSHFLSNKNAIKLHLDIMNTSCRKKRRVGHWGDGGWDVCVSDLPSSQEECIVYSFGINDDPSFDQDFVKRWPHCTVYAFDPSIGRQTGDTYFGNGIKFYNIGLGGHNYKSDRGWDMMDLESIMSMLHHEHVSVIKMDIEYSEWQVLRNWRESHLINKVDQLLAELHFFTPSDFDENIASLQWLREQGFGVFSRRENFRFGRLIDIPASSSTVRTYNCLEVGWRRTTKDLHRLGSGKMK